MGGGGTLRANWSREEEHKDMGRQERGVPLGGRRRRRRLLEHFLLELALEDHREQGEQGEDGQHGDRPPGDGIPGRTQLVQRRACLDGHK